MTLAVKGLMMMMRMSLQSTVRSVKVYLPGAIVHVNFSQIADLIGSREDSVQTIVSVVFLKNKGQS